MAVRRGLAAAPSLAAAVLGMSGSALASQPVPWQTGFQPAASPVMERMTEFHDLLLVIIIAIAVFVTLLMLYVMIRFRESRNPKPSKTSHHTVVEMVWTVVPILILLFIAIPSFRLLYFQHQLTDADMTVKVTGQQFSWVYTYPDHGGLEFVSSIACRELPKPSENEDECAEAGKELDFKGGRRAIRLLDVDNPLVVPVGLKIKVLVTAAPDDVIHSWAVPSLGVKIDAVPGRINEIWFQVNRPGIYYGQCSELCGTGHGFMPIAVRALEKADFDKWLRAAKQKFAARDGAVTVADSD